MKADFQNFIEEHPICSKYQDNADAKAIFDFLNQDECIIKMIESADQDKPALAGCAADLEAFYDSRSDWTMDFKDDGFTRKTVGRMIKTILKPFGYRVTKQKDFTKDKKGKYFTSASCYALTGEASMHIVKRVEAIR